MNEYCADTLPATQTAEEFNITVRGEKVTVYAATGYDGKDPMTGKTIDNTHIGQVFYIIKKRTDYNTQEDQNIAIEVASQSVQEGPRMCNPQNRLSVRTGGRADYVDALRQSGRLWSQAQRQNDGNIKLAFDPAWN